VVSFLKRVRSFLKRWVARLSDRWTGRVNMDKTLDNTSLRDASGCDAAGTAHEGDAPTCEPHATEDSASSTERVDGAAEAPSIDVSAELERLRQKAKQDEARIKELSEQILRDAADFDNSRKRLQREQSRMVDVAQEGLLKRLLPVIDNIERAVVHGRSATRIESLQEGNDALRQQCLSVLKEVGVTPMLALEARFDPNFHEAISQQTVADQPEGMVVAVAENGYLFKDRVLRYARVVVSRKPDEASTVSPSDSAEGSTEISPEVDSFNSRDESNGL